MPASDAARLVDELTTLLYEVLKRWEANGRVCEIVACGACRKKADKPESVVHEIDCPVYRLQRAEDANTAVIRANAEEIADLEDARDDLEAKVNALTEQVAALREAGEQMKRALLAYRFPAGSGPEIDSDARDAINGWRAALAAAGGSV